MKKLSIGAPSSIGKGINHKLSVCFAALTFPLSLSFENHAPHSVSFPEVGLFLDPCSHEGRKQEVVINDMDALKRLASSLEQVASLYAYDEIVTIAVEGLLDYVEENDSSEAAEAAAAEAAAAEAAAAEAAAAEAAAAKTKKQTKG